MSADRPRIRPLSGAALEAALPELARLRIAVFREWPYLYEGDEAYERRYLRAYADSPGALVAGAFLGAEGEERLVGAATAAPMEDHADEFGGPFRERGWDLSEVLYLGESVLLPEYRGLGVGHAFFDAREDHARSLGRSRTVFCGVVRDPADPRRPEAYAPLDPFWRKRGYEPLDVTTSFDWKEVGAEGETAHEMRFWGKRLD